MSKRIFGSSENLPIQERIYYTKRAYVTISKYCPGLIQTNFANAVVTALEPYAPIWFSAQILNELFGKRDLRKLMIMVVALLLIQFGISVLKNWLTTLGNEKQSRMWGNFEMIFSDHMMAMDYADVENAKVQRRRSREYENLYQYGNGLGQFVWSSRDLVQGTVNVVVSLAMVWSLFASMSGQGWLDTPLWILPVFAATIIGSLANSAAAKRENRIFMEYAKIEEKTARSFSVYGWEVCNAPERAKDVRIYRQDRTALQIFKDMTEDHTISGRKFFFSRSIGEAVAAVIVGLGHTVNYLYAALKAFYGAYGVGSIVQYVGALSQLGNGIRTLMYGLTDNAIYTQHLKSLYEFLDMPSHRYQGSLPVEKRAFCNDGDNEYTIEFKDVSFEYPGSGVRALNHVSLTFRIGNRLALVGPNGSGKTTLVKLLCRLYDPTEGEILLNGIDIRKYDYDEYISILSVVFQDFQLFSFSLGQNVATSTEYDAVRAEQCLRKAGLEERLQKMPRGLNTCLNKDYDENGVEISGGEAQKVALARALYRDAPFIILDEPTAGLDPIAEFEVYSRFNEIIAEKTAIYISHRLASCRFCDDIAVFNEGQVVQRGTHDALVASEGLYQELWNAQAQYYQAD